MVYQGEGAGGLPGGGGWWSLRGRGLVVSQGEGAGGLSGGGGSEGGVFRDWSRRLLGRRLDLAPYFQPGFGFPRGLRQRMTGDHYAQQHRQALSEHANQALLRPGPPPPRHSGWCLPVRRHRGTRAGVSRSAATAALGLVSPGPPPPRLVGGGLPLRRTTTAVRLPCAGRLAVADGTGRTAGSGTAASANSSSSASPPTASTYRVATASTSHNRSTRSGSVIRVACHCQPPLLSSLNPPSIHDLIPYHSPSAWSGSRSVTRNHGSS